MERRERAQRVEHPARLRSSHQMAAVPLRAPKQAAVASCRADAGKMPR